MATRHYRAQVTIPALTGIPGDAVVNTWHYTGSDSVTDAVNASDFEAQLDALYDEFVPVFGSNVMDWAAAECKHYVFEDNPPRVPFATHTMSLDAPTPTKNDWPAEVAIVLSMEADRISGVNMRRRRGRVYLGPLAVGPGDLPMTGDAVADLIRDWADAAFFAGGLLTSLAVYSPSTHHGVPVGGDIKDYPDEIPSQLLLSFHEVTKVWCDNAWDTQRRRGPRATYRATATK